MSNTEQNQIAFDMGRLAAWRGTAHVLPDFPPNGELIIEWQKGVAVECERMRQDAARIPLIFGRIP